MPSLQIFSDLHLELLKDGYSTCTLPRKAPNLVLAGDIGRPLQPAFFQDFFARHLKIFDRVFYVPGNHEHWESTLETSEHLCEAFQTAVSNTRRAALDAGHPPPMGEFIFLNRRSYDLPSSEPKKNSKTTLVGCTLWSDLSAGTPDDLRDLTAWMPDYSFIGDWSPENCQAQHIKERTWLNEEVLRLKEQGRQAVVVTHHGPLAQGCSPPVHDNSPVWFAFNSEMSRDACWDPAVLKTWIFGHTHWSVDFDHSGVRVIANQKGYVGEPTRYDAEGTVIQV